VLAALALVAVLAVIGAFTVPNLLDGNSNTSQGDPPNRQAVAGSSNREGGGDNQGSQGDGGGGAVENTPEPTVQNRADSEQTPAPSENEPEQNGQQEQNDSPEQAAAQAVEEFYTAAAAENYDKSSALLSAGWREEYFPTRSDFEITFDSLRSVRFEGEPTVEVSGDTATVTGQTVATHDDRVERNEGTWTVVKSGDRWIISGWTVNPISSRPA
ncbi:MAG TPA: hypothetical protein VGR18_02715, partial [Rubrobacter sp.]|nr:hypothetical protein [Rubrobacter sp.]